MALRQESSVYRDTRKVL